MNTNRITCLLLLALLCATSLSAAAPPEPGAPGQVSLVTSRPGTERSGFDAGAGRLIHRHTPLVRIIADAWDIHPAAVELGEGIDGTRLFDSSARGSGGTRESARAALRFHLREEFGFEAASETRVGRVRILRPLSGRGWQLEPSRSAAHELETRRGRFRATRAPISELVRYLEGLSALPVVDETGLAAEYDMVLEWDTSAGSYALNQAFADLGLELVKGERSYEVVVIERAQGEQ